MSRASPDTVEDGSVLEDAQQLVVCGHVVEVGALLVGKEQVRFPYGVQHGWVQVERGIWVFTVRQPRVIPLLPQEDVHPVILRRPQAALHILRRSDFRVLRMHADDKTFVRHFQMLLCNQFTHTNFN